MSPLKRITYALLHPVVTLRFVRRLLTSRRVRRSFDFSHQPSTLDGDILSINVLDLFETAPVVEEAERILKGERCIYGHARFEVGELTDWQRDYLGDFSWDGTLFHENIPYSYPIGVDIKTPWEVSRMHHLVTVGRAYQQTKREEFAAFSVQEITDWITANPVYYGVNWKVAMEVGIRATNLLVAYSLIRESEQVTDEFTALLLGSLHEHATYITENFEVYGVRSNHYFSDLVGLLWVTTLCPTIPKARQRQNIALRELARETLHQFRPDGLGFESSIAYHRLVLEMLGFCLILADQYKLRIPDPVRKRAEKAFWATKSLVGPGNIIPQIGDCDSGRLFITGSYFSWDSLDFSHLLRLGDSLFPKLPEKSYEIFSDSKIAITQSDPWWLAVSCEPIGQDGNGGHNHDSAGSFTLFCGNQPLIIDPGTGYYTSNPEVRNSFRSVLAHNAPTALGKEHKPPKELFAADQFTQGTLTKDGEKNIIELKAEQYIARRVVSTALKTVSIEDTIPGETVSVKLLLHPSVKPVVKDRSVSLGDTELNLAAGQITVTSEQYSPAYGKIVPTHALTLTNTEKISFTIKQKA